MTKLVRNIIIGGGSTVAVGGTAAGVGVAVSNKKNNDNNAAEQQRKAVEQAAQFEAQRKVEEENKQKAAEQLEQQRAAAISAQNIGKQSNYDAEQKAIAEQKWTQASNDASDFLVANQAKMLQKEIEVFKIAFNNFFVSDHSESIYADALKVIESTIESEIKLRDSAPSPELDSLENQNKINSLEGYAEIEEIKYLRTVEQLDALVAKYIK